MFDHRRSPPAMAPHQRPDTRGELVQVKGFDEIIVGAGIKPLDAVSDRIACGDHQHRQGHALATQAGEQVEPGFSRQAEVEQDHFMHAVGHRQFCCRTVTHPIDGVPVLPEPPLYAGADHRIIFNEQQAHPFLLKKQMP